MERIKTLLKLHNILHASERGKKFDRIGNVFSMIIFGLLAGALLVFVSVLIVNFREADADYWLLIFVIFIMI